LLSPAKTKPKSENGKSRRSGAATTANSEVRDGRDVVGLFGIYQSFSFGGIDSC